MTKYFVALLVMFFVAWPTFAADPNGYNALYECRAGGPQCNVDVVGYVTASCAQTITTADSAGTINTKLNTGSSPICIENGDYTGKGIFTLTTSGTSGASRVLRYTRSSDNDDDPWNQSSANQAKLKSLDINASYWIIHRLTFPSIDVAFNGIARVDIGDFGFANNIISRVLIEGHTNGFSNLSDGMSIGGDNTTVQNSVVRNSWNFVGAEPMGISCGNGTDVHIVNNEIYDWSAHPIQCGQNNAPTMGGLVVENNDVYLTPAWYTGDGRTRAKSNLAIKSRGTSTNPIRIIHNRVWGSRVFDASLSGIVAGAGASFIINGPIPGGLSYILVQNNIIFDAQEGIEVVNGDDTNISFIGNLLYQIKKYYAGQFWSHAFAPESATASEIYLNSIIEAEVFTISGISGNMDIRCNAIIQSGAPETGPGGSGNIADFNVFYGSTLFTYGGTDTNINKTVTIHSKSKAYSIGDLMVPASLNNYMYRAVAAGITSNSSTTPCTVLGCTFTDGSVTWQAIRGPYTFYRKLLTSPESYTIPYARAHASTPEINACPSNYAARSGIGINNSN
ncbi:MAG: hypothetical protein WD823_00945 [Sulfuricaulis sp.]|uniref:hypothetical protein n=1 Tax=Sulfuricaulis sp. TaxID=2003553 RepID=UPI0034A39D8D